MILENYNKSLKENVESSRSFTVNELPLLKVRPFDPKGYSDEDFVIPYYVDNFLGTSYTENKLTDTFTVIVSLDEDTAEESYVDEYCRWKQTTYAGEHVINLGKITSLGEHTLSIKAIESTGISSGVEFFKIYISKPRSEITLADFSDATDFNVVASEYEERRMVPFWYITPDNGNGGYEPVILHRDNGKDHKGIHQDGGDGNIVMCPPVLIKRNLSYSVTFIKDSSENLIGIDVEVHGNILIPEYDAGAAGGNSYPGHNISLDGVYHITDSVELNGETHLLKDYLYDENPPAKVTCIAARNKIGLKVLLWACKAYCLEMGYDGFVLPKYEYIISYANAIDFDDATVNNIFSAAGWNYTVVPASPSATMSGIISRNDIEVPDDIIIDFNYSSIKSLATRLHSGRLLRICYARHTEVKNLEVVGNYAAVQRCRGLYEAQGGVNMSNSVLCTFDNLNISRTHGYEMTGNGLDHNQLQLNKTPKFTKFGYLDPKTGNPVSVPQLKNDQEGYLDNDKYYDVPWDEVDSSHVDALVHSVTNGPSNYSGNGEAVHNTMSNVMYTEGYYSIATALKPDHEGCFMVTNLEKADGYNSDYGNYKYRMDGEAVCVSFYKYDASSSTYIFLKTIKTIIWHFCYAPFGATHVRFSAIGCLDSSNTLSTLNHATKNQSVFRINGYNYARRGNRIINCKIHDTRGCATTVLGHQTYIDGIITYNPATEAGSFGQITAYLGDIEDKAMHHHHMWFKRWYHWYGPPSTALLRIDAGNDMCFVECGGFTAGTDTLVKDGYFTQSIMSAYLQPTETCNVRKEFQFRDTMFNSLTLYGTGSIATEPKTKYYLKDCTVVSVDKKNNPVEYELI